MEPIYHLVTPALWEADSDKDYRADSLQHEGFIHCSFARQAARSANKFYAQANGLLLLEIDPTKLTSPLRVEPPTGAPPDAEKFPHVHGPLNRQAVVRVFHMRRGDDGRWLFPG